MGGSFPQTLVAAGGQDYLGIGRGPVGWGRDKRTLLSRGSQHPSQGPGWASGLRGLDGEETELCTQGSFWGQGPSFSSLPSLTICQVGSWNTGRPLAWRTLAGQLLGRLGLPPARPPLQTLPPAPTVPSLHKADSHGPPRVPTAPHAPSM